MDQRIRTFLIWRYVPNTFSALLNLWNWQILYVQICSCDYSSIYARMLKHVDEYSVFAYSRQCSENSRYVRIPLQMVHTLTTLCTFRVPLFDLFCLSFAHSHQPSHKDTSFWKLRGGGELVLGEVIRRQGGLVAVTSLAYTLCSQCYFCYIYKIPSLTGFSISIKNVYE